MRRAGKLSILLRFIVLVLVVIATVDLIRIHGQIAQKQAESDTLDASITTVQQDIQKIESNMESLSTDEGIKAVARGQLGLVGDGEMVFRDVGN